MRRTTHGGADSHSIRTEMRPISSEINSCGQRMELFLIEGFPQEEREKQRIWHGECLAADNTQPQVLQDLTFYRYDVWLADDSGKLLPLANALCGLCWCPLPTLGAISIRTTIRQQQPELAACHSCCQPPPRTWNSCTRAISSFPSAWANPNSAEKALVSFVSTSR